MIFIAFFLVILIGGLGALAWFGWRRVAAHLTENPEAAKHFADLIVIVLLGKKTPKAEVKPEVKRIKETPV